MPHYTPTSPVVSVLMVVMGAERSVRRAVESVQNQTLSNIQLVVVDAVGSGQVTRQLESIAERDLRVELVSAGGCARQEALDLALERSRGTYVAVVDADGWAAPKMLEELVDLADDRALELVVGGFTLALETAGGRTAELDVASEDEVFLTQHEFRAAAWRMFATGQLLPASAKLFRRDRAEEWGARFSAERESDHGFVISYLLGGSKIRPAGLRRTVVVKQAAGCLQIRDYQIPHGIEGFGQRYSSIVQGLHRLEMDRYTPEIPGKVEIGIGSHEIGLPDIPVLDILVDIHSGNILYH